MGLMTQSSPFADSGSESFLPSTLAVHALVSIATLVVPLGPMTGVVEDDAFAKEE